MFPNPYPVSYTHLDVYKRQMLPLRQFDAVIMRKDPPFDFEYLTATWLLERAEAEGVLSLIHI